MMEQAIKITAGTRWESTIADKRLPHTVQRATLMYKWFSTTPSVETEGMIVCR